jgi:uncharacterized protein YjeT (DUF2065 family)
MNQRGIELFAAIYFLVIGLSHLLRPHAWVDFFARLRSQGESGVFAEGFLALTFGAIVVSFHNVWTGLPMVLTLIGWAQVAKGLIRFVFPQLGLRIYQRVAHERAWQFRVAGAFALGVAAFLGYLFLRS